jgi:hypothetical protein
VPLIGATGKTTSEQSPVNAVATHPVRTGLLAVALADGTLLVSRDCGQSFTATARTDTPPEALAWADGSEAPRLLCIGPAPLTEVIGLSSTETADPPEPRPVLTLAGARVGPAWTIATHPDGRGNRAVALALRDLGGVLMSDDNGWNGSFQPVGLQGHDVRSLCFLRKGQRVWLLAGCARTVVSDQSALYCAEVTDAPLRMPEWHPADAGWPGGTVHGLAFDGTRILAASTLQGLLQGTLSDGRVVWQRPPPDAGLPARIGAAGPAPFGHVAFGPHGPPDAPQPQLLAAGPGHVLHSADGGARFAEVALRDGATRIGLPARWTLCSAPHAIEVLDVTS